MEQTIGSRIIFHRKRLGLTQEQLAVKLGVTAQAVSKWENDLSCPDIAIVPKLADIFGVSTDDLLGRSQAEPVYQGEVIGKGKSSDRCSRWDFLWDSGRKAGLGFSCLIILIGVLYLISGILRWDVTFWNILWPSSLLVFGLFGLYPRFSFFRLGCGLLGGYYLITSFFPINYALDGRIIFSLIILLCGFSFLADALRRPRKPPFQVNYQPYSGPNFNQSSGNGYQVNGNCFTYCASFSTNHQFINMPVLESGTIETSFGDYTVNIAGIKTLSPNAVIHCKSSFGKLTLVVPPRYKVVPDGSSAFASFKIVGAPVPSPEAVLHISSSVSFGEIIVQYM